MNKRTFKILCFIILLFVIHSDEVLAQCDNLPTVYNTLKSEAEYSSRDSIIISDQNIQYVGRYKDSIYIGINSSLKEQLDRHKKYPKNYINFPKGKLKFSICNSNIIKTSFRYDFKSNKKNIYYCYPIIIENIDSLPIELSIREYRPITLEYKDKSGNWESLLVRENIIGCTTGDKRCFIRPKEIAIFTMPIYSDLTGEFRVKSGNIYSNTIYQDSKKLKDEN